MNEASGKSVKTQGTEQYQAEKLAKRLAKGEGHRISRRFTTEGVHPYDEVKWEIRTARIAGRDGKISFEQEGVEFPAFWSVNATNIVAEKYFRGQLGTPAREYSVKQIIDRVVENIARWGDEQGRFATPEDRETYQAELTYILLHQLASFNSPVWFNVGVTGRPQQVSACFILSLEDNSESINEWFRDEYFIFKGGSGSGLNVSGLRSSYEQLSIGGYSSGPMPFMRAADSIAGAIKSGGATRRAAKMVVMNIDHPDILIQRDGETGFIRAKADEENKARSLKSAGYDVDVDSGNDSYTLQYQNANNSVRVTDEFMEAYKAGREYELRAVTTGEVIHRYQAREVMSQIAQAAWECADPGIQYHDTINDWHTAPAAGPITASNPCSEYMHLDNSPCNLASLNLLRFLREDGTFDTEAFEHAVYVVLMGQTIMCVAADYPNAKIAKNARGFRELGIGYANLGAMLMGLGVPYDSDEGRAWAAAVTSLMQAASYRASAGFAEVVGSYPGTEDDRVGPGLPGFDHPENRNATLRVLKKHAAFSRAIAHVSPDAELVLDHRLHMFHHEVVGSGGPVTRDQELAKVVTRANQVWDETLELAEKFGVENSQVSVLAPTGTISFMMDCDTTGIEPDLALKKVKKMVGGGTMSIVNQTIPRALRRLGYPEEQVEVIVKYIEEENTAVDAPALKPEHYPVFACSFTNDNLISHMGHVRMMAAAQPFLSGAISKTINMPESATVEEVEDVYAKGWYLGLKALAIYRDNCKADQPLSAEKKAVVPHPVRRKLPKRRQSATTSFRVGELEGYIHAGLYPEDSQLGELFVKVAKQGSTLSGVMDAFAIAVSLGLQYGVPLETYVDKFTGMIFEPHGLTGDPDVPQANSIMDYIFRRLAVDYVSAEQRREMGIVTGGEMAAALEAADGMNVPQAEAPASEAPKTKLQGKLCPKCGSQMFPDGMPGCWACPTGDYKSGGCGNGGV